MFVDSLSITNQLLPACVFLDSSCLTNWLFPADDPRLILKANYFLLWLQLLLQSLAQQCQVWRSLLVLTSYQVWAILTAFMDSHPVHAGLSQKIWEWETAGSNGEVAAHLIAASKCTSLLLHASLVIVVSLVCESLFLMWFKHTQTFSACCYTAFIVLLNIAWIYHIKIND